MIANKTELIAMVNENKVHETNYLPYMRTFILMGIAVDESDRIRTHLADFDDVKDSHPEVYKHILGMFKFLGLAGCKSSYNELLASGCPQPILDRVETLFAKKIKNTKKRPQYGDESNAKKRARTSDEEEDGEDSKKEDREMFLQFISNDVTEEQLVRHWNSYFENQKVVEERKKKSRELAPNFPIGSRVKRVYKNSDYVEYGVLVESKSADVTERYAMRKVDVVNGIPDWESQRQSGSRSYGEYTELELVVE
jgi:hypothetical protein